jgi:peptidoglycan/LPS O-acetylase OafA/YrhL
VLSGVALLWNRWSQGHAFDNRSLNMATFGYTAVGLCATGIVLLALRYEGSNVLYARVLRSNALRVFGKYSYAMYIFHYAPASYSHRVIHRFIGSPLIDMIVNCFVGIGLTLVLAKLSWKYFESPILGMKDRIAGYRRPVDFEALTDERPAPGLASI